MAKNPIPFKSYTGTKPYIFVSYSHANSGIVFPLIQQLHDKGYRIWYDEGIDPGAEWRTMITKHLASATVMLVFLSREAVDSKFVKREVFLADEKDIPIVSVLLEEIKIPDVLQLTLTSLQRVHYFSYPNDKAFFAKLLSSPDLKNCSEHNMIVEEKFFNLEIHDVEPFVDTMAIENSHPRRSHDTNLKANYTFEEFVMGPCNSFATIAAQVVAKAPGVVYNPLFIYGETALGKTHLMQAIGHEIAKRNPNSIVRYVTTEALFNEYINARRVRKDIVEFRHRYRNVDVLMIDDIHFLAGKTMFQEEFFHTFNELYNARKQIVLCSDRPVKDLHRLEQRLLSRLEGGLGTVIEHPDFETRLSILRYKQSQLKIQLSCECLAFIAHNISSNVRSLEGALVRATSFASLLAGQPYTIDILHSLLNDILDQKLPLNAHHKQNLEDK